MHNYLQKKRIVAINKHNKTSSKKPFLFDDLPKRLIKYKSWRYILIEKNSYLMIYRNIYLYEWKLFKIKLLKKNDYENCPFVASVKIGLKAKTKKIGQDTIT